MSTSLAKSDSLTLWDLEKELVEAYEVVEAATTDDEREQALKILDTYLTASVEKRDRVAGFLQHLTDLEIAVNSELERLYAKAERLKKTRQHMYDYVIACMERVGTKKLEGKLFTFTAKSNPPAVEITDELAIPPDYLTQPPPVFPPPKIDKTSIKKAIQNGQEVPGAKLIQKKRLEID